MKKGKFLFVLCFLFCISLCCASGQTKSDKIYEKELVRFMHFVRDSVLIFKDTVEIRPFLWNKNMFQGVVLLGRTGLTKNEKEQLIMKMQNDTSKYYLTSKKLKKLNFVAATHLNDGWKLSKPIFLRSYLLCIFSFSSDGSQKTYLYKKEKDKWEVVEWIGRIDNY